MWIAKELDMLRFPRMMVTTIVVTLVALAAVVARTQEKSSADEKSTGEGWHHYGGDKGFTRYSPLAQINPANVGTLRIAWRRPAVDAQLTEGFPDLSPPPYFRATPLIVDHVLYA